MAEPENDAPTREEFNRLHERLDRIERELRIADRRPANDRRPAAPRPSEHPRERGPMDRLAGLDDRRDGV